MVVCIGDLAIKYGRLFCIICYVPSLFSETRLISRGLGLRISSGLFDAPFLHLSNAAKVYMYKADGNKFHTFLFS